MQQVTPKLTKPKADIPGEVADFVLKYGNGLYHPMHREKIADMVSQHIGYGTIIVVRRNFDIVAVVRWNFLSNDTIKVLDLIIRPDYRRKNVMKSILIQGIQAHPNVKRMVFHRKKHNRDVNCLVSTFIGGR